MAENLHRHHWFFSRLAAQLSPPKPTPPQLQKPWLQLLHHHLLHLQLQLQPPLSCRQCPKCNHSLSKPDQVSFPHCLCAAGLTSVQVFRFSFLSPSSPLCQAPAVKPAAPELPPTFGGRGENRVTSFCRMYFVSAFVLLIQWCVSRLQVNDKSH